MEDEDDCTDGEGNLFEKIKDCMGGEKSGVERRE